MKVAITATAAAGELYYPLVRLSRRRRVECVVSARNKTV